MWYCSHSYTEVTLCWRNQCETVQLLTLTPDFIAPALWSVKSHDLNPVDYNIWVSCSSVCTAAGFVTLTRWSRTWSTVGTFPPGVHQRSGQAVASTSSSLHSSTWRTFWTQTWIMFDICTNIHFDSHISVWLLSGSDTCWSCRTYLFTWFYLVPRDLDTFTKEFGPFQLVFGGRRKVG